MVYSRLRFTDWGVNPVGNVLLRANFRIIYFEKLSLEVREVSENVTKTLPNIANPHIGIYREIGKQVLASIEETQTDRQTDVTK